MNGLLILLTPIVYLIYAPECVSAYEALNAYDADNTYDAVNAVATYDADLARATYDADCAVIEAVKATGKYALKSAASTSDAYEAETDCIG
jgi:hypothetical protein